MYKFAKSKSFKLNCARGLYLASLRTNSYSKSLLLSVIASKIAVPDITWCILELLHSSPYNMALCYIIRWILTTHLMEEVFWSKVPIPREIIITFLNPNNLFDKFRGASKYVLKKLMQYILNNPRLYLLWHSVS